MGFLSGITCLGVWVSGVVFLRGGTAIELKGLAQVHVNYRASNMFRPVNEEFSLGLSAE